MIKKKLRQNWTKSLTAGNVSVLRSFQRFRAVKLQHKNVPLTTLGKRKHPPIQTAAANGSHRGTRLTNQNRVNILAGDTESDGNC